MAVTTITFEAETEVVSELDHAASLQHRDRNAILQDAIVQYLASDHEFRSMIEDGLREADAGDLIDHSEIEAKVQAWSKQIPSKS
jgi:predicted transcriptional regulator